LTQPPQTFVREWLQLGRRRTYAITRKHGTSMKIAAAVKPRLVDRRGAQRRQCEKSVHGDDLQQLQL
jgi:hypothetical protein